MNQPTTLQGLLKGKCPRCRQGDVFETSVFNIAKPFKMHKNCPHCNLHYEMEPGFFYGSMYVSYAISVAILATCGVSVAYLVKGATIWAYLTTITIATLLTFPFNFRFSRTAWLYMFISYAPDHEEQEKNI
jgi:uncharacterized protein (DUF983 family)